MSDATIHGEGGQGDREGEEAFIADVLLEYFLKKTAHADSSPLPLSAYLSDVHGPKAQIVIAQQYLLDHAPATGSSTVLHAQPETGPKRVEHYEILKPLGRGGQGVVYLARDTKLQRLVALKVLEGALAFSEEARERLRREALAASRLEHPSICPVYEVSTKPGGAYLAMQFVPGLTLQEVIRTQSSHATPAHGDVADLCAAASLPARGITTLRITATFFATIADALHQAHQASLIHRDIKPSNLMVREDGRPVILDFGLARHTSGDVSTFSIEGSPRGTPAYMSPEQVDSDHATLDGRSDVYSLGIALYECLTFERPYEATTPEGWIHSVTTRPVPDVRRRNPAVPRDLAAIVSKMTEKDRNRRYVTCAALAADLCAWSSGSPVHARPVGRMGRAIRWTRREPAIATAWFASVLLAIVASIFLSRLPEIHAGRAALEDQRVESSLEHGYLELDARRVTAARREFLQALSIRPDEPLAVAGLVISHLVERDGAGAWSVLEEFSEVGERHPELALLRSDALRALARDEEAGTFDQSFHDSGRTSALAFLLLGVREMRANGPNEVDAGKRAIAWFQRAILHDGQGRSLYYLRLAHAASKARDADVARMVADALISKWPRSASAWAYAGRATATFDQQLALSYYDRAIELDSKCFAARMWRGEWHGHGRDLQVALRDYSVLAELDPERVEFAFNKGLLLKQLNRLEEAITSFDRGIEIRSDIPVLHVERAAALQHLGRAIDSVAAYTRAVELGSESDATFHDRGLARMDAGDLAGAIDDFQRACEIAPTNAQHYRVLAITYGKQGGECTQLAIETYDRAMMLAPQRRDLLLNQAAEYFTADQLDQSLVNYVGTIERHGLTVDALVSMLRVAACLDEPHYHAALLDYCIARYPDCLEARRTRSHLALVDGRYANAAFDLEFLTEFDPSNPAVWNDLAICRRELGLSPDALSCVTRAIELDQGRAEYRITRGSIHMALAAPELAKQDCEQAVRLAPDDPDAWEALGQVCDDLDETTAASAAHARARLLRVEPEGVSESHPNRSDHQGVVTR
ncbi:MAG: protein kinase [Planctomycetes bacterium]|nr:protein kinase [Planctomycetota bacterium]